MAFTTFLAEVRLRFFFELEPDRGSSDCVIARDGLAKSGAEGEPSVLFFGLG